MADSHCLKPGPTWANIPRVRNRTQGEDEGLEKTIMDMQFESVPFASASSTPSRAITVSVGTPLSVAARELILHTLEHCGGERKRTAEMLGICTKTLYNRLREYGIREERRSGMGEVSPAP
jgi:DNA-binding NtrC family response regulator